MNLLTRETPLVKMLANSGAIDTRFIDIALKEHEVTHEDFSHILVRNGFIRQRELTDIILKTNEELLYDVHITVPGIPAQLLLDTQTVIMAETEKNLYVGTLSEEYLVREQFAYYDSRKLVFMPLSIELLDDYLADVAAVADTTDSTLVDSLLKEAISHNASDLHIIPREKSYTILQRRDGVREWLHEGDLDEYHVLIARIKDRANMDLSERRKPQDGSFFIEHHKRTIDLRVATSPATMGEYVVVRLLDPDAIQPKLGSLGITNVNEWRKGVHRSSGLCLICGPTGSGKTTTLNSSVREIDRIERAVFTIEDPVEYKTPFTGQVNVNEAVSLDFNRGLKAFMRQDPDIIVAGEVRDEETARISVKGAETGHVMIATLHTSSIFGTINRLRDLGVAGHELRYILRTILVQRLVRTYCVVCEGHGCVNCQHSGYSGRTIVSECAYFADEDDIDRVLNGERWWPLMVEDGVEKVRAGVTSPAEIIRVFGPEGEEALREAGFAVEAQFQQDERVSVKHHRRSLKAVKVGHGG
ncbi:GspE/PulE family protein [Vreelandella massiliensis]|uniref:GspE/PulE family protein n=1 Tax=Vreelandella massiliensis TaxID=1816686 RepID=UPI00096A662C|nr:GspE/PulE family protein [Halomonas massiliensis]